MADLSEDERAARKAARQAARDGKPASSASPVAPADPAPSAEGEATKPGPRPKKRKGPVREWVDALVWALVVMFVVRTFLVDNFRIPTGSMEKTLLIRDFLFVSKNHYGIRTPMTISVPFTKIYVPGLTLPWTRLPGFSSVQRGDVVVFNWPGMPTEPNIYPVDKRDHYIKRTIGIGGDSVAVVNGEAVINGQVQPWGPEFQRGYFVVRDTAAAAAAVPSVADLTAAGASDVQPAPSAEYVAFINATKEVADAVAKMPGVAQVMPYSIPKGTLMPQDVFPAGQGWSQHNYGPVWVPKKGATVTFTPQNAVYLVSTIDRYEGVPAAFGPDGTVTINGQPATTYTFKQDYFFMMGDNRDNSLDSRFWGFVPMDHVVGKAVLVYLHAGLFPPRFNPMRIGRHIWDYSDAP